MDHLPDAVRRAIRTFIQAWIGSLLALLIAQGVPALLARGELPDLHLLLTLGAASGLSAVIAFLSYVQNALEDSPSVPFKAILKAPASPGADPVPQPDRLLERH